MTGSAIVVELGPRAAEPRASILSLPHAGAGITACRWLRSLALDVELLAAQLPGRERRIHEPPLQRSAEIIEALALALLARGSAPTLVHGHSMGAWLALALARRLGAQGPRAVILGGARPPHLPAHVRPRSGLDDAALAEELRRMGGAPPEVLGNPELVRLLLPAVRADLAICETEDFAAGPPLDCDLWVLMGRDDPLAPAASGHGWRRYTRRRFELRVFPGGHFFHLEPGSGAGTELERIVARYGDRPSKEDGKKSGGGRGNNPPKK